MRRNGNVGEANWYIAVIKSDSGEKDLYSIIYSQTYFDEKWRQYSGAQTKDNEAFNASSIDREVNFCTSRSGCSYKERVRIRLTEEQVNIAARDGVLLNIIGRYVNDKAVMTIPSANFQTMMARVRRM